ncbi:MAG: hypothetical protein ACRDXD_06210 [Acidimicrobiia bacterium]
MGTEAAERLHDTLLQVVEVWAVDQVIHGMAVGRWRREGRRGLSLVDVTSFVMMETRGMESAFAFDDDFIGAGFATLG